MKCKKGLVFGVVLLALSACGHDHYEYNVGQKGDPGAQGPAGQDGANGQDGADGTNGILGVIDPCGDAPGVIDEVLIRLADGSVLVSFSANANGQNTRLSILPPGSYVTTDGSSCNFTVNANGTIQ